MFPLHQRELKRGDEDGSNMKQYEAVETGALFQKYHRPKGPKGFHTQR